ncbi:hypothetical protein ORJ04_03540 [Rheinheimera baltica]|uniref:Uncharacterized protein n=1 Tax=Rheinheimera baltica TaxID=67576 RepID=A0ABT9HV64_9GAMM|nr:hypothetical protein [Rheinheimera baltica]MDP5135020.1 hypothetical protein [Rheinheimera baltica]
MSYLSDQCLLPKTRLEQTLRVPLGSIIEDNVRVLQQQSPRICQDMLSDILHPFQLPQANISATAAPLAEPDTTIVEVPLYWQRLILPDRSVCSELVLMSWRSVTYISYLNILPDTFGLFTPLSPKQAMCYANKLVGDALNNITAMSAGKRNHVIAVTLINPNLAAIFKQHAFIEDPSGPMIVGLPLPARFYRLIPL